MYSIQYRLLDSLQRYFQPFRYRQCLLKLLLRLFLNIWAVSHCTYALLQLCQTCILYNRQELLLHIVFPVCFDCMVLLLLTSINYILIIFTLFCLQKNKLLKYQPCIHSHICLSIKNKYIFLYFYPLVIYFLFFYIFVRVLFIRFFVFCVIRRI